MNKNPQIFHGEWWIPAVADPNIRMVALRPEQMMGQERKHTGTLTYFGDQDSTLELYHTPSKLIHTTLYQYNSVMWGKDVNGHIFTLFNVVMKEQPLGDISDTKFVVSLVIEGEYILSLDDQWSKKCTIHFPYLNNWLFFETKNYIVPEIDKNDNNKYHLDATLRDKALLSVNIKDGFVWNLFHNIKVGESIEGLSINKTPYLEIESSTPASTYSFLRQVSEFEQFLSIALCGEQNASNIQFLSRDSRRTCTLLFKRESSTDPFLISLIKYCQLKDKLPSMLCAWHDNYDNISPISSYLINSFKKNHQFDVPDFLIIAQALDGYHKRFVNKKRGKDIRQYEAQIEILLNQFKDVKVIQECRIDPTVLKDTRHKYTHLYPDDEESKAVGGEDLFYLTEKCKVLLICCILNMLGLTNQEINLCCENSPVSQIIDSLPFED